MLAANSTVHAGRAAPHRAPRHPGDADRRERTPDPGLGARDEAVKPGSASCSEASSPNSPIGSGQQDNSQFHRHGHWAPPGERLCGQFIEVDKFLQIDLLGAGRRLEGEIVRGNSAPVFQSLIWTLYCGPWSTALEVMTYRQG